MFDSTLPLCTDTHLLSRERQCSIVIPAVIQNVQTKVFLNLCNTPPVQAGEIVKVDLGTVAPRQCCHHADHNTSVCGPVTKTEHWNVIIQDHTRGPITAILRDTSSKCYINAVKNEAGTIQLVAGDAPQVFELVRVGDKWECGTRGTNRIGSCFLNVPQKLRSIVVSKL